MGTVCMGTVFGVKLEGRKYWLINFRSLHSNKSLQKKKKKRS